MGAALVALLALQSVEPVSFQDVSELKRLLVKEARPGLEVKVEGTLTFVNQASFATYGFLQSGGDGIYLQFDDELLVPPYGRRVSVGASIMPGEFAVSLQVHEVKEIGPTTLPEPASRFVRPILTGVFDSRWVSIEGLVRRIDFDEPSHLHVLLLAEEAEKVQIELPGDIPSEEIQALLWARVRVEGACGARFNTQRQLVGARVLVPSLGEVKVVAPAIKDLSTVPLRKVSSLLKFDPKARTDGLTRVRGFVTYAEGDTLVLQDGSGGLMVHGLEEIAVGQDIEVLGYSQPEGFNASLLAVKLVSERSGQLPTAVRVQHPQKEQAWLQRVRVLGEVVSKDQAATQILLRVEDEDLIARIGGDGLPRSVKPGAMIWLQGILFPRFDSLRPKRTASNLYAVMPNRIELLVASAEHVRIHRHAPFWSHARVVMAAGSLLTLLMLVLGVVWMLRKQVSSQTNVIRAQLAQQANLRRKAQSASRAKTLFLATMSHELRTPLHAVLGALSVLPGLQQLSSSEKGLLESALGAARKLGRMLEDLLEVSRAEAGQTTLEPEKINPKEEVERAIKEIEPSRGPVSLRVSFEDVPDFVTVDTRKMRHVLQNLIDNGIKFTREGEVVVLVSYQDGRLQVEVSDTGIGIDQPTCDRLFRRFEQADGSFTRTYGGAGLGLSVCKFLCERMGGMISVRSEVGKGSNFRFELPAPEAPPSQELSSKSQSKALGLTVLVADDNQVNQRVAKAMLRRLDCEVQLADDGQEALDMVQDRAFDLVLMDIHMPRMDGVNAAKAIRRVLKDKAPPVVAVTADTLASTRERCVEAGIQLVLTKPLAFAELQQQIVDFLQSS